MMFSAVLWLLLVALVLRRLLSSDDSRALPPEWTARTDAELARLRDEVERLTGEVSRLEEEQGFLLRLMGAEERPVLPRGTQPGRGAREDDAGTPPE